MTTTTTPSPNPTKYVVPGGAVMTSPPFTMGDVYIDAGAGEIGYTDAVNRRRVYSLPAGTDDRVRVLHELVEAWHRAGFGGLLRFRLIGTPAGDPWTFLVVGVEVVGE